MRGMADQDDDIPVIDLTDPVNAFARDILRANPDDPRFQGPKIEIYSEEWMKLFGKVKPPKTKS